MGLQALESMIRDNLSAFGVMNLGQLIDALKATIDPEKPDKPVRLDFFGYGPTSLETYRGYYDHLAIDHDGESYSNRPVAEFVEYLENRIGTVLCGYKGGDYPVNRERPVWVAKWSECFGTGVVGVKDCGYQVVIETKFIED